MAKKQQGFAVTGSDDAAQKGSAGGKKGGKAQTIKGFAKTGNASEMAKRSWEKRRQREAAKSAEPQPVK